MRLLPPTLQNISLSGLGGSGKTFLAAQLMAAQLEANVTPGAEKGPTLRGATSTGMEWDTLQSLALNVKRFRDPFFFLALLYVVVTLPLTHMDCRAINAEYV